MWRGRPTWAEIDLDAVAHNVRELKQLIGSAELLAVVKANAYGHGAVMVAKTALENGAKWLGVACTDEGVQLRQAGFACPILVFGYVPPWEAETIVSHRLTPTVNTRQLALALSAISSAQGVVTPVHVKVDTGLTRYGLLPHEILDFARGLLTLPNLRLEGLYTHFATADETDKSYVHQQLRAYRDTLKRFEDEGIRISLRHAANSGATLDLPESWMDMVRCGISIYGLYPSEHVNRRVKLRPVMSLKTQVSRVRQIPEGVSVSYGRTYTTRSHSTLAAISIGYADGLSRAHSNEGSVLVRGHRVPIVGRVCMDQCVVDVSSVPNVQQGDEVVVIGRQGDGEITADEIARQLGTINYEITCAVSARVPRAYVRHGKIIAAETLTDSSPLL
ncbi:MAG: alanine racemase [Chloroflexi bacterium]|nr:alanine racemase [Chloroflexota bacterium]